MRVTACALVRNDWDGLLLVRTPLRGWELPGGIVEVTDASCGEALEREVLEESQCVVRVRGILAVTERLDDHRLLTLVFDAAHVSGEPTAGAECVDAAWMEADRALELVRHGPSRLRLRLAVEGAPPTAYTRYFGESGDDARPCMA